MANLKEFLASTEDRSWEASSFTEPTYSVKRANRGIENVLCTWLQYNKSDRCAGVKDCDSYNL